MNSNGLPTRHLRYVVWHSVLDVLLFYVAFSMAILIRSIGGAPFEMSGYWSGLLVGAPAYVVALYVCGFYAEHHTPTNPLVRVVMLCVSIAFTMVLMTGVFYLGRTPGIGRSIMLIGNSVLFVTGFIHHTVLGLIWSGKRERVAMMVTSAADEAEAVNLAKLCPSRLEFVGIIATDDYTPVSEFKILGRLGDIHAICESEDLDRVICTQRGINAKNLYSVFCKLRWSGTSVMTILCMYEEFHQCCPVGLMNPEWLLNASGAPHMFYIRKIKRVFDIIISTIGLVVFGPILLLGMLAVKLTSRGPVFYRQVRSGRFGRPFEVFKLRSMRTNAEAGTGAVWSSGNADPRVTPIGGFLRKFRIDEIPQLINVFRGEMSFVGPRPERPEFVRQLEREIPYFGERLLVQPGITGWAQVNYPYGSSIGDARRKLEYDLYYMKNMSLLLDLIVIFGTIRTVLVGGLGEKHKDRVPTYVQMPEAGLAMAGLDKRSAPTPMPQ